MYDAIATGDSTQTVIDLWNNERKGIDFDIGRKGEALDYDLFEMEVVVVRELDWINN